MAEGNRKKKKSQPQMNAVKTQIPKKIRDACNASLNNKKGYVRA
jgi:hypothetical protein